MNELALNADLVEGCIVEGCVILVKIGHLLD
jgi:hypothetical protein